MASHPTTASRFTERPPRGRQLLKLVVFALTPAVVLAGVLAALFLWWRRPEGRALNRLAWESSFTECWQPNRSGWERRRI